MITNHLLEEKERVQKELAEAAQYGLKLRYGQREGGTIEVFKI